MYISLIQSLDISLFKSIFSQTTDGDKRSLLSVQRATARKQEEFCYLEIGSYLGGTLQPYLLDDRCVKIYSIDSRPKETPDDRSADYIATYSESTTEGMLALLKDKVKEDISKIECFESDASEIIPDSIQQLADVAFIDGEHTYSAVISDFKFCEKVLSVKGTVIFHDFEIIYPAIIEICKSLRKKKQHLALKLEDQTFAIFYDVDKVNSDPYLKSLYKKNRYFMPVYLIKTKLKKLLPAPIFLLLQFIYHRLTKNG